MRKTLALVSCLAIFTISGCANALKTMVAHYSLSDSQTFEIARGNAFVNACQSRSLLDRGLAYEYSTAAAEMLDLTVSDAEKYKKQYDYDLSNLLRNQDDPRFAQLCGELTTKLPAKIADLRTSYGTIARQLGVARLQENAQIAQMLSASAPTINFNYQTAFPPVTYKKDEPAAYNVLIQSSRGLTQCRVTKNNFVFCL